MYSQTNDSYTDIWNCSVGQYSAMPYTQNMHAEWKTVTGNPQVTIKLKEFAKMCCACNTIPKLVLRTSVTRVTLPVLVRKEGAQKE